MWAYPYLTIFVIIAFVAIIASMGVIQETRIQLVLSLLTAAVVIAAFFLFRRRLGGTREVQAVDSPQETDDEGGSSDREPDDRR
jgi:L-asparagine transporter-like permease